MKKRWLAALLTIFMVIGTVGMAAAQEAETEEETNAQGPPAHIQRMLENKATQQGVDMDEDGDEDGEQGPPEFVKLMLQEKFSIINKNKLMIHGNPFISDLPPVIKQGRTLIPVGAVVKGLGADSVDWDKETETVTITKGDTKIVLEIGDNKYTVYKDGSTVGVEFEMDTEAQILGNRTFVPLKFIAVALGEEVEYDDETKIINVGRKRGQEKAAEARMKNIDNEKDNDDDD